MEHESSAPDFWSDNERAQKLLRERAEIAEQLGNIDSLGAALEYAAELMELFADPDAAEFQSECEQELAKAEALMEQIELQRMLSGEHDSSDAILEINSGAGGTEAQDWGEMLLRMYLRWADKKGFKTDILSIQPGEEAGIKNASVLIQGSNAFGYLRSERGVHRLVRISPFDSNARRHTSFASVSTMPDLDDDVEVDINEDDLRIDTYRSSGAGGQHVNKTDSAVRITHIPTGIIVACQTDRSQHKNKAVAMRMLKAKMYELEKEKKAAEMAQIAGERKKIDFGSQIRSYVMQPYQMVKDLRTGEETGDVQSVMDGSIDRFIRAYLMSDEFNF